MRVDELMQMPDADMSQLTRAMAKAVAACVVLLAGCTSRAIGDYLQLFVSPPPVSRD